MERDWAAEYNALPPELQRKIYEEAKTACPSCGIARVPVSWAVTTANYYEELKEQDGD